MHHLNENWKKNEGFEEIICDLVGVTVGRWCLDVFLYSLGFFLFLGESLL